MHDGKRNVSSADIACKAVHLRADRIRDRLADEYGEVVSAQASGRSAERLPAMRQTRHTDAAPKREKVLLGQMPPALVERSSGAHHAQSCANENVPVLRRRICRASERESEILQPEMLQSRPKTGCVISTNISPLCRDSLSGIAG